MSVLNKDDFMSRLKERIGEDTSDEAIAFIEDMTDTYNDMETRTVDNSSEWEKKYNDLEQKYNDLDESWKAKYKARFFDGGTSPEEVKEEQEENVKFDGEEDKTFEDLFEEREG